MHNVE